MKKILFLLSALAILTSDRTTAAVIYDPLIPQVTFAVKELETAMTAMGKRDLAVTLVVKPDKFSPETFQIRRIGPTQVIVTGSDATGAMYGGLEVADRLRLGLPIENQDRAPFVGKRGIKFNIAWDARTPSYDDSGDAAQNNIEAVWDFEFWKAYLDALARYRYNVLSLWSAHPYPSIIQLEEYPEAALEDVYRIGLELDQDWRKSGNPGPWGPWDRKLGEAGTLKLVKKISVEDKIAHWKRVFDYAGDRGIEIYLFHWNVFTFGATGKHGITQEQTNPITVDYLRKSVRQALLTYPQIKGIGVTAGENADNDAEGEHSIENFLFNTYGRGIMDVLEEQPDRDLRFIFRQHQTGLGPITEAFADFPKTIETSFKYAIGHMYSMRRPVIFESRYRAQVEEYGVKCWLNLRNDDMFVLRWGNPDFTREYLLRMPHHLSPGFYLGSDGYVWGREFVAKNPEMAGRLEIDKHWYQFRQWGQLAYDPFLDRDYWEAVLQERFPGVDAGLLYDAWAATSEIVPQINSANFTGNDAHFAPEGCMNLDGYLTVDGLYFNSSLFRPMQGSGILSVIEWGKAVVAGKELKGITPLQVADNLDAYAETALAALPALREQSGDQLELQETLNDIEAMAYLGRYYADKTRGAAKLAVFREDPRQKHYNAEAVAHLKDAVEEWKAYAAIASAQYKTQLLARTDYLDWNGLLVEVEKEVLSVKNEGDYPDVRFTSLKDGARIRVGTDLQVQVEATDGNGIRELKLYLNSLYLNAAGPGIWSGASDALLKSLKPGWYHLEAVAEDTTGTFGRREIQIVVGDVSENHPTNWRDEIHQIILNEGERMMGGDVRDFPRLECHFTIDDDVRLMLNHGASGSSKGEVWNRWGRVTGYPQYLTLEEGRLVACSITPDQREVKLFKTPPVSEPGSYKFGITVSKKLVIYRELEGGGIRTVWRSN